jgi:hypothetical protein
MFAEGSGFELLLLAEADDEHARWGALTVGEDLRDASGIAGRLAALEGRRGKPALVKFLGVAVEALALEVTEDEHGTTRDGRDTDRVEHGGLLECARELPRNKGRKCSLRASEPGPRRAMPSWTSIEAQNRASGCSDRDRWLGLAGILPTGHRMQK